MFNKACGLQRLNVLDAGKLTSYISTPVPTLEMLSINARGPNRAQDLELDLHCTSRPSPSDNAARSRVCHSAVLLVIWRYARLGAATSACVQLSSEVQFIVNKPYCVGPAGQTFNGMCRCTRLTCGRVLAHQKAPSVARAPPRLWPQHTTLQVCNTRGYGDGECTMHARTMMHCVLWFGLPVHNPGWASHWQCTQLCRCATHTGMSYEWTHVVHRVSLRMLSKPVACTGCAANVMGSVPKALVFGQSTEHRAQQATRWRTWWRMRFSGSAIIRPSGAP
jgi:hypothetical protein